VSQRKKRQKRRKEKEMGLFRKKEEEGDIESDFDDEKYLSDDSKEEKKEEMNVPAEIVKIKATLDSLSEIRRATQENFTRITEQIGELRGMILDTNKSLQEIEVKVVKAVDMVESVQPDKLMIEVKRQDAKIEGLTAKIETNRSLANSIVEDMKELRRKVEAFRGIEEVIKLNEDVKKELREIEKTKAIVERHSDKAETLFVEIQKKVADFDDMNAKLKDLDKSFGRIVQDFDVLKIKFSNKADKKEIEDITAKFQKFEDHYGKVVELLTEQTKELKKYFAEKLEEKFEEADRIKKILIDLTHENPNVKKNMEKIRELAREEQEKKEEEKEEGKKEKKGVLGRIRGIFSAKKEEEKIEIPDNIGAGDDKPVEQAGEGEEEEKEEL